MFRKPFKIKTNTKVKSSERKKFIQRVTDIFHLNESDVDSVFGKKDLYKVKVASANEEDAFVYNFDNTPYLIEFEFALIPTIFMLWGLPHLLPIFSTHDAVVPKLQNGADLMVPGIVVKEELSLYSFGKLEKGALCAVNTVENWAPFAVGHTNLSSEDMFMCGGRGKAVNIFHILGDELCATCRNAAMPRLKWPEESINEPQDSITDTGVEREVREDHDQEEEESAESENLDDETAALENESTVVDWLSEELAGVKVDEAADRGCQTAVVEDTSSFHISEYVPQPSPDDLLVQCFLHALRYSVKDKELPMLTNVFYANHVLPFCPPELNIEVKKTKYKKVSVFMREMEERGLIRLEEPKGGSQFLASINRQHDDITQLRHRLHRRQADQLTASSTAGTAGGDSSYRGPPQIEEVWFVVERTLPLLQSQGYRKGDHLTAAEVREAVTNYVKRHGLQSPEDASLVCLNDILTAAAYYGKNPLPTKPVSWKQLFGCVLGGMTSGYKINYPVSVTTAAPPAPPLVYRNQQVPTIVIDVQRRASNKQVTRVANLGAFRIDESDFARRIQLARACSCTVVAADQSRVTSGPLVQAQGDQRNAIGKILLEEYNIPRKFVTGMEEKKPKQK